MPFVDLHALSSPLNCMGRQGDGCCTGWDNTVRSLAQRLSKQLGVADTTYVEAWLQKVTLVSEVSSYNFGTSADAPPCTFATMTVMMLPPTKVRSLHPTPHHSHSLAAQQGHGVPVCGRLCAV